MKNSDECTIASKIADKLKTLGFDPYIAVEEQTLRGVTENIFEQLRRSEYFVFVDFKREQIKSADGAIQHRGSLFSHQELAIASFLDLQVLAFQEDGVKERDGIIGFLQTNSIPFTDRHLLPDVVVSRVRDKGWTPGWRNELALEAIRERGIDALQTATGKWVRYFHIKLHNRHYNKVAANCYVFLDNIRKLRPTEEEIPR